MPNQVLTIDPQNELKFKVDFAGMFEQGCTTYLRLGNPTSDTVLFKIKTTAPKKYCPVYIDPNEKHKHKFMVQSVVAPEGKTNVDQWKEIGTDQLMDYKLKCIFETPRVVNPNLNDAGDNAAQNEITKKRVAVAEEPKPATKNLAFSKSENVENDLQKASLEVVHLREEESKLRHENLQLKEELLRLRQAMGDGRAARTHSFGPDKQQQASMMPWIGVAIAMALLGVIIGKFFM
ncbi:putative VAMP-associated protein [Operophtera brumata]|uniref:Putative VAMP-associated protein n=1 Tax=Operophtera brumata TaxID=104452 RepID=A0A0L7LR87_OPEBR|nr:putative VAMP-associated protein [Operophtera brumata]